MSELILAPHQIGYTQWRRKNTPAGMSYCSSCDQYRPTGHFSVLRHTKSGLDTYCRWCRKATKATKAKHEPPNTKEASELLSQQRQARFNLTLEEYQALLDAQGGVCAICGQPETKIRKGSLSQLCIDHDHDTGRIRGLLCSACNVGLGSFKDSLESLSNAIDYLMETHR